MVFNRSSVGKSSTKCGHNSLKEPLYSYFVAAIVLSGCIVSSCLVFFVCVELFSSSVPDKLKLHAWTVDFEQEFNPCEYHETLRFDDVQIRCDELELDYSIQEMHWKTMLQSIFQEEQIALTPVELEIIKFYTAEKWGDLRYGAYRWLINSGRLNLTPSQILDEIEYLKNDLPLTIEGKNGIRTLDTMDVVRRWKTDVVQQEILSERLSFAMLDIEEESQRTWKSGGTLNIDIEFPKEGYVMVEVFWNTDRCVNKRIAWSYKVKARQIINVPMLASWSAEEKECMNSIQDWFKNPNQINSPFIRLRWAGKVDQNWKHIPFWTRLSTDHI